MLSLPLQSQPDNDANCTIENLGNSHTMMAHQTSGDLDPQPYYKSRIWTSRVYWRSPTRLLRRWLQRVTHTATTASASNRSFGDAVRPLGENCCILQAAPPISLLAARRSLQWLRRRVAVVVDWLPDQPGCRAQHRWIETVPESVDGSDGRSPHAP